MKRRLKELQDKADSLAIKMQSDNGGKWEVLVRGDYLRLIEEAFEAGETSATLFGDTEPSDED